MVITDPALCRPWLARHVDDPRASDEAWAVTVPVWADFGEVAVLPEAVGGDDRRPPPGCPPAIIRTCSPR